MTFLKQLRKILWGGCAVLCITQSAGMPLLDSDETVCLYSQWQMTAGKDALEAGLPSLAEGFFRSAMQEESSPSRKQKIGLDLSTALIAQKRFEEARTVLMELPEKKGAAYFLRMALLDCHRGAKGEARSILQKLSVKDLATTDLPWYYLLKGFSEESPEKEKAFDKACELCSTYAQRAQFEAIIWREKILSGKADPSLIEPLREKVGRYRGESAGFQFAKELAIVLDKLGRKEEALQVLEGQLRLASPQQKEQIDQIRLLEGLLGKSGSTLGQYRLEELVREGKNRKLQEIALQILAQVDNLQETNQSLQTFLDKQITEEINHPLLDHFYILRAQLALKQGRLEEAQLDAQHVLETFPGSEKKTEAIRLLAYISWEQTPPNYRMAAYYLQQLRTELSSHTQEWIYLGIMIADCYFLNGDYGNAARLYGSIGKETQEEALRDTLLFQQVLSEIKSHHLVEAEAILNDTTVKMDSIKRWQAEWNLIVTLKDSGFTDDAFERIHFLLNTKKHSIPNDLRLRLMWLEARLLVDMGLFAETASLTDQILHLLSSIPPSALKAKEYTLLASQTILLKGQIAFLNGDVSQAILLFDQLRKDYAKSYAAVISYLTEARYYASIDKIVEAQKCCLNLADTHPRSRYAPEALYEAAINAEKRELSSTYQESLKLLERLCNDYPDHFLVFYARTKQGDLLRKLNDFGAARQMYENVLNRFPDHPHRDYVELALDKILLAQGAQDPSRAEIATEDLERLFNLPNKPISFRAEVGNLWGFALQKMGDNNTAMQIYWLLISQLLKNPQNGEDLNEQGRYWIARTVFDLATLLDQEKKEREANTVYQLILDYKLPGEALAKAKLGK